MSIGIIKHIDSTITYLQNSLWDGFNNDYNGRSFRLKKNGRIRPEIYPDTSNESEEVFCTDKKDSIIHFDIEPSSPKNGNYGANSNVNIIFAIDLGTIYNGINRAIAAETAKNDINKVLVTSPFEVQNIVEFPDSLSDYDIDIKDEHKFNMQPYFVVKFECVCNYVLNNACTPITPTQYNLTMQSGEGGSVEPTDGTYAKNVNQIVPINATAEAGYKFSQWLINGVQDLASLTYVKMTNNITAIAEFAVSLIKQLTIAVSGNGTTNPVPGNYDIESGQSQLITAIENDENYYFDYFDQDGNKTTSNPGIFTVIENSLVVAYFTEYVQWVFDNSIGKVGDSYYYLDKTSNGNNVKIKNTSISNFDGIGAHILVNDYTFEIGHTIELHANFNLFTSSRYMFGNDLALGIRYNGSNFLVFTGGTISTVNWVKQNKIVKFSCTRRTSTEYDIYIDDSFIGISTTNGDDLVIQYIGCTNLANFAPMKVSCVLLPNFANYCFQEKNGLVCYNSLVNENHGIVTGANISFFRGSTDDNVNPVLLIYGYERYESDTTPGDYIDVIFANGVAQSPTIAGYSLKETIQPNAGFSDTGNTLDGIQITGLESDATYDEVYALTSGSDYEIIKTATEVTQLKVK